MQTGVVLTDTFVAKAVTKLVAGAVFVLDTLPSHTAYFEIIGVTVVAGLTFTKRLAIYYLAACIVATYS